MASCLLFNYDDLLSVVISEFQSDGNNVRDHTSTAAAWLLLSVDWVVRLDS